MPNFKSMLLKNNFLIYIVPLFFGFLIFLITSYFGGPVQNLLINISAALISIPIIFITYGIIKNWADNELNKHFEQYVKSKVDKGLIVVLNHICSTIYPYNSSPSLDEFINIFGSLDKDEIKNLLNKKNFFGFQIFKIWEIDHTYFEEIITKYTVDLKMNAAKTQCLLNIIISLSFLILYQKVEILGEYTPITKTFTFPVTITKNNKITKSIGSCLIRIPRVGSYRILSVKKYNKYCKKDTMYELVRDYKTKSIALDFGYFKDDSRDEENVFLINEYEYEDLNKAEYSELIYVLLQEISKWLDLTGGKFLLDAKTNNFDIYIIRDRINEILE